MVRTQIQLTEQQAAQLKDLVNTRGESMASIIRQAIDQYLLTRKSDISELYRRAESVIGGFEANAPDVSTRHNHYLEESYQ